MKSILFAAMVLHCAIATSPLANLARGNTFEVIHTFTGGSDGANPFYAVAPVGSTIYGTAFYGGASNAGTVFSMNPDGSGFQTLRTFSGSNGVGPSIVGPILAGSTLYGTTYEGGTGNLAHGTIFSMNLDGSNLQTLYTFENYKWQPSSIIRVGSTLYGTAQLDPAGVFSFNLEDSNFRVLHAFESNFPGGDGGVTSSLTLVGAKLYGTTNRGGINGYNGIAYSMDLDGSNYQVLHSFTNASDGAQPSELIAVGSRLYGTTFYGGAIGDSNSHGKGTIFSMNLDGSDFQKLHAFVDSGDSLPAAGLTLLGSTLYGTTYGSGGSDYGTAFSIDLDGSNFQTIHNFTGGDGGARPWAPLVAVGSTLYGSTVFGGTPSVHGGNGTLFRIVVPEPPMLTLASFGMLTMGVIAMRRRGHSGKTNRAS